MLFLMGAASRVSGRNAKVLHKTDRYATLVGYNSQTTRSKRIPIVTAYLKVVESRSGFPVLLKMNEGPYHSDNQIALL